jgi:hypothetical protein
MGPRGEQEPHIVAYDGYCQLDVRVLCEGGVLVPDAAERTQLYADVQQQYAEMRAALQNLPAELRGPIDSLNLRVAEERIVARFEADDEATQRLLSNMVQMMFLGVQSFAGPAGGPAVP